MEKKVSAHVVISGRVQGVFFRAETRRTAESHAVCGWVKNREDGRVEARFEGNEKDVKAVIDWCHKGPALSNVTSVEVTFLEILQGFSKFGIEY
ncbi:MAG: acylphosphatase [Proteobacteria bacterium]|nr:acylphosphatase [Pseudomonadota bacterium]